MTLIETGVQGAKRQSWREANPRDMLKQIIKQHPNWDGKRVFNEFCKALEDQPKAFLDTIIEYWFANNYHSLVRGSEVYHEQEAARTRRVSGIKSKIEQHIVVQAQIMLLDLFMPNGKALRDCTGRECTQLAKQVGNWLGRLAKKLKPTETVGHVMNEKQVRDLYEAAGKR